jgi:hypothetical protein
LETPYGTTNSIPKAFQSISNDVSSTFLEVFELTQVPMRSDRPIGKYQTVCANDPLRENRDKGLISKEFATLVINGNIKF